MRNTLCTLEDVATQLNLPDDAAITGATVPTNSRSTISADTANKRNFLTTLIYDVSELIEQAMRRRFVPYVDTHYYERTDIAYNAETRDYHLMLGDYELLELTTLTNGNDDTVASANTRLYPRNRAPRTSIRLLNGTQWQFDNSESEVVVTGIWGYHEYPDTMWQALDTIPGGGLTDSATSLTVSDSSTYEVLQYLRMNDEYLRVTAIDGDTDTLTLERGLNGTTAAAHTAGDTIDKYQQTPDVRRECRRLVILEFAKRAGQGDVTVYGGGEVVQIQKSDIRLNRRKMSIRRV